METCQRPRVRDGRAITAVASFPAHAALTVFYSCACLKKKKGIFNASASVVVSLQHPAPGLYRPCSRSIRRGTRDWVSQVLQLSLLT